MNPGLRELLTRRVDALYRTDADGRIVATNEWDSRPAPRFHLMRTADGAILRCRADLPDDLVRELGEACGRETWDPGSDAQPSHDDRYLELMARHGPVEKVVSGPAYMCVGAVSKRTGACCTLVPRHHSRTVRA